MNRHIIFFCLSLLYLLPFSIHAKPTDKIIFINPDNEKELLETSIQDTRNTQLVFTHSEDIWHFAVQPDGPYIVFIAKYIFDVDVFLYDRTKPSEPARNLTQQKHESATHVDISKDGDIVFINSVTGEDEDPHNLPDVGINLIRHSELHKNTPKIKLLVSPKSNPHSATWSPDANHIAYGIVPMPGFNLPDVGVYIFDVNSSRVTKISDTGYSPTFSPDSKKLAFHLRDKIILTEPREWASQHIIPLDIRAGGDLKWSPDGKYIIYGTFGLGPVATNLVDSSQTILFERSDRLIWITFDWVHTEAYPVEPAGRMIIPWGTLKNKQENLLTPITVP